MQIIRVGDKIIFNTAKNKEYVIDRMCFRSGENKWTSVDSYTVKDIHVGRPDLMEHIYLICDNGFWAFPWEVDFKLPTIKVICTPK